MLKTLSGSPTTAATRVAIGSLGCLLCGYCQCCTEDVKGGGGLLAWAGHGEEGGAGARGSAPRYLARGYGLVGVVGAGARAGAGRPALVTSEGGADGGGWC